MGLSLADKITNAYKLDLLVENHFLPEALGDQGFPNVDKIISYICDFNRILTTGQSSENDSPGEFRGGTVTITNSDHEPPNAADVGSLVVCCAEDIVRRWDDDPVNLHAFVLWRINWIHPFFDGNGRTARKFSYFLLCVRFGKLLPGLVTITSQIQHNKDAHYRALREADQGNIEPLQNQTREYLRTQLSEALRS